MAKSPAGWYKDPLDKSRVRWWDGAIWTIESHPREFVDKLHRDKGHTLPDYDVDPDAQVAVKPVNLDSRTYPLSAAPFVAPITQVGWSIDEDGKSARWFDGSRWSGRFAVDSLFESVTPEFVENGGSPSPAVQLENKMMSRGDFDLLRLLLSRMNPARLEMLGYRHVSNSERVLSWLQDPDNPSLSRGWDGFAYTGEVELTSIVSGQSESDMLPISSIPSTSSS